MNRTEVGYIVEVTEQSGATSPIDTITAPPDYTAEMYIKDCESNADADWCEMLHGADEVKLIPLIETFYTGGGIWLTSWAVDDHHYYIYEKGWDCLTLYSDRYEGGTEFPCERMEWSKDKDGLTSKEWAICSNMMAHHEANAR